MVAIAKVMEPLCFSCWEQDWQMHVVLHWQEHCCSWDEHLLQFPLSWSKKWIGRERENWGRKLSPAEMRHQLCRPQGIRERLRILRGEVKVSPSSWVPSAMIQLNALYFAPRVVCQWMCWFSVSVILLLFLASARTQIPGQNVAASLQFSAEHWVLTMRSNSIPVCFFCL